MKLNCGETYSERIKSERKRLQQWHNFFALLPRRVGANDCRWLETIERKGQYYVCWGDIIWVWEYRAKVVDKDQDRS